MKKIIAIPIPPVAEAGAKVLYFESVKSCAKYFGINSDWLSRILNGQSRKGCSCGYSFDFQLED